MEVTEVMVATGEAMAVMVTTQFRLTKCSNNLNFFQEVAMEVIIMEVMVIIMEVMVIITTGDEKND